jgi:hypothetical protein
MIFVGDVSLAEGDYVSFRNFPTHLLSDKAKWCINLEGPITGVHASNAFYNHQKSIDDLFKKGVRVTHAFVANNHIHDLPSGLDNTINYLRRSSVQAVGVADCVLNDSININAQTDAIVLGFGWDVIGCRKHGKLSSATINILDEDRVLVLINSILKHSENLNLFVCFHASYELDPLPQPIHRELAKLLVDLGVSGVIFHHSHVVGPVEVYKNTLIAYGLGNWTASRGRFLFGEHIYPPICNAQIAIEFTNDSGAFIHHFTTNNGLNIKYEKTTKLIDSDLIAEFSGFSDSDYVIWYRKNVSRNNFLPVFTSADSRFVFWLKRRLIDLRVILIKLLILLGLKHRTPKKT